MTQLVTFTILGTDFQTEVVGNVSEQEAHDLVTSQIAKRVVESFRIKAITPIRKRKRLSLFSTYFKGFDK